MKKIIPEFLEKYRIAGKSGDWNGHFVRIPGPKGVLNIICSNGGGWEHVSVSCSGDIHRIPSWKEMSFIAALVWDDEECPVQFRPPKSRYVNVHPGVLHWWRPTGYGILLPPIQFV